VDCVANGWFRHLELHTAIDKFMFGNRFELSAEKYIDEADW
jgi:hypothetical protein